MTDDTWETRIVGILILVAIVLAAWWFCANCGPTTIGYDPDTGTYEQQDYRYYGGK
uniref:Uncharacterized protein n=1 Tax=viral metagenome TaxID=1070528 RepID=A0A6H1ZGN1_9ZZZZ